MQAALRCGGAEPQRGDRHPRPGGCGAAGIETEPEALHEAVHTEHDRTFPRLLDDQERGIETHVRAMLGGEGDPQAAQESGFQPEPGAHPDSRALRAEVVLHEARDVGADHRPRRSRVPQRPALPRQRAQATLHRDRQHAAAPGLVDRHRDQGGPRLEAPPQLGGDRLAHACGILMTVMFRSSGSRSSRAEASRSASTS